MTTPSTGQVNGHLNVGDDEGDTSMDFDDIDYDDENDDDDTSMTSYANSDRRRRRERSPSIGRRSKSAGPRSVDNSHQRRGRSPARKERAVSYTHLTLPTILLV